ncbi:DUF262 domain-containing protein [Streptomyces sp. NPDC059897]|uniref:GmrSD restriction endonuclease domain-containing protein n=1 Tax=Streptomyces sp. NPDC059897 TaxID=3346994 RepID=UPI003668A4DE
MGAGIEGATFDLKELFGHARYDIEYYQREYAWSADDVRTLVADLLDTFNPSWSPGQRHRRDENDTFFLGPFVYAQEREEDNVRFLVDGQQRFTTLHLLFLHLYRRARELPSSRETEFKLDRVITEHGPGKDHIFRIDIDERRPALEALYRDRPYEVPLGASLSVRNLHARSTQMDELLAERLEAEHIPQFVDWLLSKVQLVGIKAPSRSVGFRIFESMNDRGARLTSVDLLKSYLLSNVRAGEEELNKQWRHMLAELTGVRGDSDAPRAFLRAALLARHAEFHEGETAAAESDSESIDTALNIWVRRNARRIGLRGPDDYFRFVEDLIDLARHHRTFLKACKQPYEQQGLATLYYNDTNGLTDQMALILAAIQPHEIDTTAKEKAALVANFLDLLFVDRAVRDEPLLTKDFEPLLHRLIPRLRACRTTMDVSELLSSELPPPDSFAAVETFGMRGNNKAQVRYLLARLTTYVETGCERRADITDYLSPDRTWQIEHLYANHPKRHASDNIDEVTFRAWRNRLGVLVLLTASDNASYGDLPLAEKTQRLYARQNVLTAVLSPGYRRNATAVKRFVEANPAIASSFREFGGSGMAEVVRVRGMLYRRLCERIWDPEALGFQRTPPTEADGAPHSPTAQPSAPHMARPRLKTQLAHLMRCGVLPPGTRLEASHRGRTHVAVVDGDGYLTLESGDRYSTGDEAGMVVRGTKQCSGMAFWHVATPDGARRSLREVRAQAQSDGLLNGSRRR